MLLTRTVSAPAPGLAVRGPVFRLTLLLWIAGFILTRVARLAVWVILHPGQAAAFVGLYAVLWCGLMFGWWWVGGPLLSAATLSVVWWTGDRDSWWRWVGLPARAHWRRVWTYRRDWQPAMVTAGLDLGHKLPRLSRVRSTRHLDTVRARMIYGQTVDQWAAAAPRLRQTFGVLDVRARAVPGRPHLVELVCLVRDPLVTTVPVPDPAEPPDLGALVVGRREDGAPLTLRLAQSHVLVAGETGSGKGSVLWSTVLALAPAVADGTVHLWGIDPKGGMELAPGSLLFRKLVWGQGRDGGDWQEPIAALLEEAVAGMQARAARYRGATRQHVPTVAEPLIVVVIDELAALTAYVVDPAMKRRLSAALSLLLSQGRAVGVDVIAATQDARKEVVTMRDLFPTRIALRTAEPAQADLILGRGAYTRGARTDWIDVSLPGVGYVVEDDSPEPVRVRFGYAGDERIGELAAAYAPGRALSPAE